MAQNPAVISVKKDKEIGKLIKAWCFSVFSFTITDQPHSRIFYRNQKQEGGIFLDSVGSYHPAAGPF